MVVRPSVGSQSCGGVTQDEWMLLQEEEIPLWGLERDTRHARGRGGWTTLLELLRPLIVLGIAHFRQRVFSNGIKWH